MSKAKHTSGILCRDEDGTVVFFPNVQRKDIRYDRAGWRGERGGWWVSESNNVDWSTEWDTAEWQDTYDLAPPEPGKCFECDVEL